ncbi:MAG TPA: cyclic pyranopterin monophosphate synthase MoaC [Planctomycetota bacterium]|nr:cyclic pyranopterin monophosphate synthase MoaC [Planctomycetota bacterium]
MARGKLSHVGPDGSARMVDVGAKPATHRVAVAEAEVDMKPATASAIRSGRAPKGAVLEVARVAGINAAKLTSALIPMCHPLALTKVGVEFAWKGKSRLRIEARVEAVDRTGVEMEALTAAAVCALTVYDMCKAIDREMEIGTIRLLEKSGGKSGPFMRHEKRKRK